MTLTYEDMTADWNLQYYYNIYPEEGKVRYEGESDLDVVANSGGDSRYTSTGSPLHAVKSIAEESISKPILYFLFIILMPPYTFVRPVSI